MAEQGSGSSSSTSPSDAVNAAVQAAMAAVKNPPGTPAPDPRVAAAFALGWQIAELYRPDPPSETPPAAHGDLPGLRRFSEGERADLALRQVEIALAKLWDAEKGDPPDLSALKACVGPATDAATRMPVVREIHVKILTALTAADFRLGKAYGLGRSLADTCRNPTSAETLLSELKPHRIAKLRGWLDDLASALPPHAGHSVSISLERWSERLYLQKPKKPGNAALIGGPLARSRSEAETEPEERKARAQQARQALNRQGQMWRSLLSGEKSGPDMLHTVNYLDAASRLFATTARAAWRLSLRLWPVAIVALVLFAGGLTYILVAHTQTSFVAGVTGVLASLGITWKGAGTALGNASARAGENLWGAELDAAIADAITLLPPLQVKAGVIPRKEKSRDYAGRLTRAIRSPDYAVRPELLEHVLNPDVLLDKVKQLQGQKPAGAGPPIQQSQPLPPTYLEDIAQGIREEKTDPHRVQRAGDRTGPAPQAPPPVVYLSRKPQVSQFQSIITHCVEKTLDEPPLDHLVHLAALDRLWQEVERLSENLGGRFRDFGPCDIGFIETKLAQLWTNTTGGRHGFSSEPVVAPLAGKAKVFLLGDWATGLPQARNVANRIREQLVATPADTEVHVIHLGDTYYSGLEDECRRRFLDLWPVPPESAAKSWTLAGNHDMYAGGHGYFDVLLADPRFDAQQRCSYFAISNEHWQIVGLDSSYKDPDKASLESPQAEWLRDRVAKDPARGTILLTHHQPFSAWENVETPLPVTVDEAVKPHMLSAWFWGHEHRCAVYDPRDQTGNYTDIAMYEAVVGHGGVPAPWESLPAAERRRAADWVFEDRYKVGDEEWLLGGFAVLTFEGDQASVQYYDEYGKPRFEEGHSYPSEQAGTEAAMQERDGRPEKRPDRIPRPDPPTA